ncbi:efflux RND transporter periplasmic adaptor subunit [Prolixibacteraceae bacterium Z1-6]|uniref:Efflux RND transporter periplasmic adaptor subunit n=1 Tax=Draconibacterium aestuarii TaxID=2998507 RepID=A0A9X3F6L1_9BACT|nr:efflux RND transporter periplasmic adaptor subunit [Prolixibacteraceae bacterium Z1-6]
MKKIIYIVLASISMVACNTKAEKIQTISSSFLTGKMTEMVETATARSETGEQEIRLTGKVTSLEDSRLSISAMVTGKVQKVNVQLGEMVKKGQLLATIYSPEIAELDKELEAAKNELAREEKEYAASVEMYESGLMSERELTTAKGELMTARAEVKNISTQIEILGNNSSGTFQIKAPISGIVEERNINTNSFINDDFDEPMFVITNLDLVTVELNIFESNFRRIKEGQQVDMSSVSYPDLVFEGTINRIIRVIDPETKVMKARVVLENKENLLLPEMFMRGDVSLKSDEELLAVPSSSLIFKDGKNYVVIQKSEKEMQNQRVEVWGQSNGTTYISHGIEPKIRKSHFYRQYF